MTNKEAALRSWAEWLNELQAKITRLKANSLSNIYLRGQRDSSWDLIPVILRLHRDIPFDLANKERHLHLEFLKLGTNFIPSRISNWDTYFLMRHHGVPTRLLDWTTSHLAALFFAIQHSDARTDAKIWLLNPFDLNRISAGGAIEFVPEADSSVEPWNHEEFRKHFDGL